jgi:hypothetical protein
VQWQSTAVKRWRARPRRRWRCRQQGGARQAVVAVSRQWRTAAVTPISLCPVHAAPAVVAAAGVAWVVARLRAAIAVTRRRRSIAALTLTFALAVTRLRAVPFAAIAAARLAPARRRRLPGRSARVWRQHRGGSVNAAAAVATVAPAVAPAVAVAAAAAPRRGGAAAEAAVGGLGGSAARCTAEGSKHGT